MLDEGLAVVGPGSETDQRGEVVGNDDLAFAVGVESGHASKFGNAALCRKGRDIAQNQFLLSAAELEFILAPLYYLHD